MSSSNILNYVSGEFQQVSLQEYEGSSTVVSTLITIKNAKEYNVASYDVRVYADAGRVTEIIEGLLSNQLTFFRDDFYTTESEEDIITGFILNSATYEGTLYVDLKVIGGFVSSTLTYQTDPIATTDILIPVNGIVDSLGNRAIQKKISWNPWETWKTDSITGDLRFPRGEAGVFGEYENLWDSPTTSNATLTDVGAWLKIENTAAAAGYALVTLATTHDEVYCSFIAKKGNTDDINIVLRQANITHNTSYTFSTGAFGTPGNFDSITSTQINGTDEVLIKMISTGTAAGTDYFRVFASNAATTGLYTYYKEISYVGGIDYPVPYVKGIHTADSWVHPVNWNESTDWTIDMWFKPEIVSGTTFLFDSRDTTQTNIGHVIYISAGFIHGFAINGSSTDIASGTILVAGQYTHVRIIIESTTSMKVYQDGVLVITISTNLPVLATITPKIILGDSWDFAATLNGYISDIMIRPTADTSTTHYDLGLPWTNPENPINTEHGAYQDKFGNIVGETITANEEDAYSVVEQFTIDDQQVTQWSNGDMEIIGSDTQVVAMTVGIGSVYRSSVTSVTLLEFFIENPNVVATLLGTATNTIIDVRIFDYPTLGSFRYVASNAVSETVGITIAFIAKGKYK